MPGCYQGDGPLSTTVSCVSVSRRAVSNVQACHRLDRRLEKWAYLFHDGHVWLRPDQVRAWVSDPAVLVSGRNPWSPSRALTLMMPLPFLFPTLIFFAPSRGFQHPSYNQRLEDLHNNHCEICTRQEKKSVLPVSCVIQMSYLQNVFPPLWVNLEISLYSSRLAEMVW